MRAAPDNYGAVLASAVLRPCWEVTSWLGPTYLGAVEVKSGTVTETAGEQVTGKLDLTVPNVPEWRPSSPTAPLGWYGQQLHVRTGWMDATGHPLVWFDLGRYRVRKPTPARDVLSVAGDSLEQLVLQARFIAPTNFPASTYKGRTSALLKSILPVKFDPKLVDRSVKKQTYERERLDSLADTMTAWPAQLEMLPSGVAYVSIPWESRSTTVRAVYADGPGGTVIDVAPTSGEDDQNVNAVVFSSEPDDGKPVLTETAYVRGGPLAWGGPYGYVPDFASSPLLTTRAQLQAAAKTRLAKLQRSVQQVVVSMVDDPRIQLGDVIRVKSAQRGTDVTGRVIVVPHGITGADRASVDVTLSVLSGIVDGVKV
jgi:predicted aconitase with swiveling domain